MRSRHTQSVFRYSEHTNTWSRVLVRGGGDYTHQVEIPISGSLSDLRTGEQWGPLVDILIARIDVRMNEILNRKDVYTAELPEGIVKAMELRFPRETVDLLLHADLYPLIDWSRYNTLAAEYHNRIPFELCSKQLGWHFSNFQQLDGGGFKYNHISEEDFADLIGDRRANDSPWIGGVNALLKDFQIQVYGVYDTNTNCVFFYVTKGDLDISEKPAAGEWHNSQFIHRGIVGWDLPVKTFMAKILGEGKMNVEVYNDIMKMIDTANVNLTTLTKNKTAIA